MLPLQILSMLEVLLSSSSGSGISTLVALSSGVIALVGVGVGGLITRRTEERKQDKERMLQTADAFLAACTAVSIHLRALALAVPQQRRFETLRTLFTGGDDATQPELPADIIEDGLSEAGRDLERLNSQLIRVRLIFGPGSRSAAAAERAVQSLGTAVVHLKVYYETVLADDSSPEPKPSASAAVRGVVRLLALTAAAVPGSATEDDTDADAVEAEVNADEANRALELDRIAEIPLSAVIGEGATAVKYLVGRMNDGDRKNKEKETQESQAHARDAAQNALDAFAASVSADLHGRRWWMPSRQPATPDTSADEPQDKNDGKKRGK